jgi:hypothetical protein
MLARRRKKKQEFLKKHLPSGILVDTIGAIILREIDKVVCEVSDGSYHNALMYFNYSFKYSNIELYIKVAVLNNWNTISIENFSFSVGNKKDIVLTDIEKKKLLQYLKDAHDIKQAKLDAEREKQRQLDACDALENLMQPEVSYIPVAKPCTTFTEYVFADNCTNGSNVVYFPSITSSS